VDDDDVLSDMSFRSASESAADEAVVAGALTRSFLALEREMLNIFDAEGAGDGSTAVVVVRLVIYHQ
jgi:hypothetical protein